MIFIECYNYDGNSFEALFCFECPSKSLHYFNYSSVKLLQLEIFRFAHFLIEVSQY